MGAKVRNLSIFYNKIISALYYFFFTRLQFSKLPSYFVFSNNDAIKDRLHRNDMESIFEHAFP